jgi:glycosyltransferase involved in cell wall biosynthesis
MITIITNTIRRPIELVTKSVHASLSQNDSVLVILMDQNPKPLVFSESINSNPRFKQIHCQVPAVSMARNRAEYSKNTEWIVFCDDDGYLEDGYIQKLQQAIVENPEIEIFAGSIKRIDNGDFYSRRHALGGNMKWFWNSKLLMGSNFAIKRSVFEELGKFDENLGAGAKYGSSEETDLAWNAFFHHKKMKYFPELVVFTCRLLQEMQEVKFKRPFVMVLERAR